MIRIIGFEGSLSDALVTYGAAAVEVREGMLVNSFTWNRSASPHDPSADVITRFRTAWEVDADLDGEPLVVLAVRRDEAPAYVQELHPDTGRLGGYIKTKREKPYTFYLLRDRDALQAYATEVAQQCAELVMSEAWKDADALGLIRCALTLVPRDPTLLALRTFLSPKTARTQKTAERLLEPASQDDKSVFRAVLTALEHSADKRTLYLVKYEDGDQRWGGFDLDDAVDTFRAIDSVQEKLAPSVSKWLPFLTEGERLPRHRLQSFRSASAEIGFGVLGKTMRERVLRYFELEAFANVLRGHIPDELKSDAAFLDDLRTIVAPEGGAVLKHQPIGSDELEPVVVEIPEEDDSLVDEQQFRVLGFVQGFYREVKRAEVRLSPVHVEAVFIGDDGSGLTPVGAEILRSGEGHFLPAVFALLRRTLASGRTRWFLQRMTLASQEPQIIDTLGSALVPKGLFSPAAQSSVTFQNGVLTVGTTELPAPGRSLEASKAWMTIWNEAVQLRELGATAQNDCEWFPPVRFRDFVRTSSLARILLVLGPAPEGAAIDQLVQMINDRFYPLRVRRNNTWRAIRQHPDLFQEGEDDVRLTDLGRQWATAFQRYEQAMP